VFFGKAEEVAVIGGVDAEAIAFFKISLIY